MSDFYFIGEEELVVAFRLVGVDGRAVNGREEALEAFLRATGRALDAAGRPLAAPGIKVLVLSTAVAALLETEARDWQFSGEYPLIVEIPSPGVGYDEGRSLVSAIREAVGIRV